ncbi:MAG TPA: CBS domain-containing protein [Nitrospiria bacterium]|jgi:CBS domain-containing protein
MRKSEFFSSQRDFHSLTVGVVMEREVVSCREEDTGKEIASKLTHFNIGSLPVVDGSGKLVGLISEFDLLKVLMKGGGLDSVEAGEVMSKNLKVVQEDTPVEEAIRIFEAEYLIRMPVVNGGKLVGVLARRDILFGYIKATNQYWP